MLNLLERIKFRIVFWEAYNNTIPYFIAGLILGFTAFIFGFILGRFS